MEGKWGDIHDQLNYQTLHSLNVGGNERERKREREWCWFPICESALLFLFLSNNNNNNVSFASKTIIFLFLDNFCGSKQSIEVNSIKQKPSVVKLIPVVWFQAPGDVRADPNNTVYFKKMSELKLEALHNACYMKPLVCHRHINVL